jgi:hypothetical protein
VRVSKVRRTIDYPERPITGTVPGDTAYADGLPVGLDWPHSNGCERDVATRRGENAWLSERDVIAPKELWFIFLAKLAIYAREGAGSKKSDEQFAL